MVRNIALGKFLTRAVTGIAGGTLFLVAYVASPILFSLVLLSIGATVLLYEWPQLCESNSLWLLTPLYPIFPILSLVYLNHAYRSLDILLPLYPFFISWAADTFGYITGSLFGRHKICPSISPKKSWEGLAGSIFGVFLVNRFFVGRPAFAGFGLTEHAIASNVVFSHLLWFSIVLTVIALCGDLFESLLKRRAGIKDSGTILPGHGGLLDRFDSVFFVGVFVLIMRMLVF